MFKWNLPVSDVKKVRLPTLSVLPVLPATMADLFGCDYFGYPAVKSIFGINFEDEKPSSSSSTSPTAVSEEQAETHQYSSRTTFESPSQSEQTGRFHDENGQFTILTNADCSPAKELQLVSPQHERQSVAGRVKLDPLCCDEEEGIARADGTDSWRATQDMVCSFSPLIPCLLCGAPGSMRLTPIHLATQDSGARQQFASADPSNSCESYSRPSSRNNAVRSRPTGTSGSSSSSSSGIRSGEGRSHVVLEDNDFAESNVDSTHSVGRSNHNRDTRRDNHRAGLNSCSSSSTSSTSSHCYRPPGMNAATNRASSAPIRKQSERLGRHQTQGHMLQRSAMDSLNSGTAATAIETQSHHRRGVCVPVLPSGREQPLGPSRRANVMMNTNMSNQGSTSDYSGVSFPPRASSADNARVVPLRGGDGIGGRHSNSSSSLPVPGLPRGAPRQSGISLPGFGFGHGGSGRPGSRESGTGGDERSRKDQRIPRPVRRAAPRLLYTTHLCA